MNHVQKTFPVGPRPVDNKGLSLYCVKRDESPEPAVVAVIPIVPHHKQMSGWNSDGTEIGDFRFRPLSEEGVLV